MSGPASTRLEAPGSPLEALECVPWFEAVPGATLARLAEHAVLHRVPAGVRLFEQAETPNFAEFVMSGSIQLMAVRGDDETLIELVRPFDLILPAALLTSQPYLLAAQVRDEARVLMVQAEAFRGAVAGDHAFCLAVLACLAAQFRRQVRQAKAVRLRSAAERIGAFVLALADAAGADRVRLPHEKWLIASQLGMTRETLSRTLRDLAPHGVRVTGDIVRIENRAAARAAFPFDPLIDGPEAIVPLAVAGQTP